MRSRLFLVLSAFLLAGTAFGQATMTTSGDWTAAGNWTSSNPGDMVTESVTINNNVNPTLNSPSNITIGTTTLTNNNTLTINSGARLNIGDVSHANSLITTNNNTNITVGGTLEIWGDLQVNNNVVWSITGTVIIHGNVIMLNNAALNVTGGTLQVGGNFTGGNNTAVTVNPGSVAVGGSVNVGNGSTLGGCSGCFQAGGGCSGAAGFCGNGALPITLASFDGRITGSTITLDWSTATEINFDHFLIEKLNGETFAEIGSVPGSGNSTELIKYSFEDQTPSTGANYYRLRSIDFDGTSEHSKVIKITFDASAENKVTLYPNPVTGGTFNVVTSFPREDGDKILIYNNVGVLVGESQIDSKGFVTSDSLSAGIYTLCYVSGGKRCATRFVVR